MEWDASPPLGLGKLCQHNSGHNSIVRESSNAGTIVIFFQHKENYNENNHNTVKFRKKAPPRICPSKYKPPKLVTQKKPPLNRPSKYKPPGGLYLENCPQIQNNTKQKR